MIDIFTMKLHQNQYVGNWLYILHLCLHALSLTEAYVKYMCLSIKHTHIDIHTHTQNHTGKYINRNDISINWYTIRGLDKYTYIDKYMDIDIDRSI